MNNHQAHHDMQLEATHASGAEEWVCPTCGRHMIMQWLPKSNRIILYAGDESAIHSGSKRNLVSSAPEVGQADEDILSDELKSLLEDALNNIDFTDD